MNRSWVNIHFLRVYLNLIDLWTVTWICFGDEHILLLRVSALKLKCWSFDNMKITIHWSKYQVIWNVYQCCHVWNIQIVVYRLVLFIGPSFILDKIFPKHILWIDRVLETQFFPVQRPYQIQVRYHRWCWHIPHIVLSFSWVIKPILKRIHQLIINQQIKLSFTLCECHRVSSHAVLIVFLSFVKVFRIRTCDWSELLKSLVRVHFWKVFYLVPCLVVEQWNERVGGCLLFLFCL